MTKTYVTILILVCMGLSVFLLFKISQDDDVLEKCITSQFVVGRKGQYCYANGHHRKDLDIIQEFTTLKECEQYLDKYPLIGN